MIHVLQQPTPPTARSSPRTNRYTVHNMLQCYIIKAIEWNGQLLISRWFHATRMGGGRKRNKKGRGKNVQLFIIILYVSASVYVSSALFHDDVKGFFFFLSFTFHFTTAGKCRETFCAAAVVAWTIACRNCPMTRTWKSAGSPAWIAWSSSARQSAAAYPPARYNGTILLFDV